MPQKKRTNNGLKQMKETRMKIKRDVNWFTKFNLKKKSNKSNRIKFDRTMFEWVKKINCVWNNNWFV